MLPIFDPSDSNSSQKNLVHFAAIFSVAEVDGAINPAEKKVLFGLADKLNINEDQFAMIVRNPQDYAPRSLENREDGLEYLFDLFTMIYADNEIDDAEVRFIHSYAISLGFTTSDTTMIISRSMEIFNEKVTLEDYVQLFVKT